MTNYEQYVANQKQIDILEESQGKLREEIKKDLPQEGFKNETINAYWTNKKKWNYTENVKSLEASVKKQKEIEEESGAATFEEVKQLTIKVK